jgi:PAS domain-containing protein
MHQTHQEKVCKAMRLEIHCQDRVGIAQDVLNILVHYQIDLRGIEVDPSLGRMYVSFPSIDFEKFQELMAKIRRITGVDDVRTTSFLPSEREHNELSTLLKTLPDGVIAIDTKANVTIINDAALQALSVASEDIMGQSLANMVKGFNFLRWLESDDVLAQTRRFEIHGTRFIADVLPVTVTVQSSDVLCPGENLEVIANVSGGGGPYSYSWNTGETTSSIFVSPQSTQTYTVSVTDNCLHQTAVASSTIEVPIYLPIVIDESNDITVICPYMDTLLTAIASDLQEVILVGKYFGKHRDIIEASYFDNIEQLKDYLLAQNYRGYYFLAKGS